MKLAIDIPGEKLTVRSKGAGPDLNGYSVLPKEYLAESIIKFHSVVAAPGYSVKEGRASMGESLFNGSGTRRFSGVPKAGNQIRRQIVSSLNLTAQRTTDENQLAENCDPSVVMNEQNHATENILFAVARRR